jgi:hypothetical protein
VRLPPIDRGALQRLPDPSIPVSAPVQLVLMLARLVQTRRGVSAPSLAIPSARQASHWCPLCFATVTANALTRWLPQANAVSDKLLDLRECKLQGSDLSGKTLSGALLLGADLSNSNLREAVFSKAGSQALQHAYILLFLCGSRLLTWSLFCYRPMQSTPTSQVRPAFI